MKIKKAFFLGGSLVVSTVLIIMGLFLYDQSRQLPEQAYLGEQSMLGMNRSQALFAIEALIEKYRKHPIEILAGDQILHTFTPEMLGVEYSAEHTLQRMFDDSNWVVQLFNPIRVQAHEDKRIYKPTLYIDKAQMKTMLRESFSTHLKDPQSAQIVWKEGAWGIQDSEEGRALAAGEVERSVNHLVKVLRSSEFSTSDQSSLQFDVTYEPVAPSIFAPELENLLTNVVEIIAQPIEVIDGHEKTALSLQDGGDWLIVDSRNFQIDLNNAFVQEWISNYATERDRSAGEVAITAIEEEVSRYDKESFKRAAYTGGFEKGKKINQMLMLTDLHEIVFDPNRERVLVVQSEITQPRIDSFSKQYQFPQILSTGVSSYRLGNHPNRVRNIKLSLESFQGVVLDPGEEFSFNRVTGWITPRKGYTKTKVIIDGQVKEGVGGGVCQSSTTLYRGILNAGLPVTERRNHSLDISYYHAYGYGLDATVYTDTRNDLKFVNDFPGPILVNVYTDDARQEAFVEFYGTTDERKVELALSTSSRLYKRWDWKVIWPDREEARVVESRYIDPKEEEEEEEVNPLEA